MKPEEKERVEKEREENKEQEKKPYSAPKLTNFGETKEFTGGGIIISE
jgi:hypothetical protein